MDKDNVKCCNCEFKGLVEKGAEECPSCHASGCLAWIEGEPEEVEI